MIPGSDLAGPGRAVHADRRPAQGPDRARDVRLHRRLFAAARPVDEVLERAGIAAIADRLVGNCSGGEQQRLRFAMALLPDPALMVLDEPTTGMDVEGRRGFWAAIRRTPTRAGRSCSPRTISRRPTPTPTGSSCCARAGSSPTAPRRRSRPRGRSVRAGHLPGADSRAAADCRARLGRVRGDRVLIQTSDTDAVARYLLTSTQARDLEITARGIEDAFLALTSDDNSTTSTAMGASR